MVSPNRASVEDGDPTAIGAPATASVTVLNTPPTAPGIVITPDEPVAGLDDLVCSVDTPATDADDDALTYGFAWEVDGTAYTGTPIETPTTSTVSGTDADDDALTYGFAWEVDGASTGPAAEATVDVTPMVITHPGGGLMLAMSVGTFEMGCTAGQSRCSANETVHTVTLTHDFYLGTTEVTQAEHEAVIGSNPSSYTCNGYRLPTEAEWEYAARAGTDLLYAGSNTLDDVGWYDSNSGSTPHPVSQKDPNAWSLYDMSGNVWEWVWDWYGSHSSSPATDPTGPESGTTRVRRGGVWNFDNHRSRVVTRTYYSPSYRDSFMGFRLARTVP